MIFNKKATVTRPVISTYNSLGEPNFTTSTTITTNKSCYFEKIFGYQQTKDVGFVALEYYKMFISSNIDVHNNDNFLISSVNYMLTSVAPIGKRFLEVAMQRTTSA